MKNVLTMSCHSKVSDVLSPCREGLRPSAWAALPLIRPAATFSPPPRKGEGVRRGVRLAFRRLPSGIGIACLLFGLSASAQTPKPAPEPSLLSPAPARQSPQLPPPGSAKISLLADKAEFFLGENILLHYRIENSGKEPLGVDVGGDYRGGTRANRFKVTVVDAAGRELPDPAPTQHDMGGLSPLGGAKPGAAWFENVWLLRYRTLDQPGDYTVTVFHDLGWGERQATDPRVVTLKLRLKMPNEAQARQVIADMETAKSNSGSTWGTKGQPAADFSLLKFPVYRPLLAEREGK